MATGQTQEKTKNKFDSILDNVLGKDGIKTDLRVKLSNDTYARLAVTIMASGAVLLLLFVLIGKLTARR